MAIALLNEMTFTQDSITSEVISAHCKPVIYFSATTAAASAVITLTIGSNNLELNAVLVDTDVSYTYWECDVQELLKYFLENNDITDEFEVLADGIDTSAMTGTMNINIQMYNSSDISIEDDDFDTYPSHLWHDIPQESGFNLWDVLTLRKVYHQKWCNDTYNALYFLNAGVTIRVAHPNSPVRDVFRSLSGATMESTQFKFTKRVQDEYTGTKQVAISDSNGKNAITYTGIQTINATSIQGTPAAGQGLVKVRFVIDKKEIAETDVDEYCELVVNYTTGSPDSIKIYQSSTDRLYNYNQTIELDDTRILSSVVFTPIGYENGAPTNRNINTSDVRLLLEYDNYADQIASVGESFLTPGINTLTIEVADDGVVSAPYIAASAAMEIDFKIEDCYIPLVWFHQSMGFVSYAFEGLQIEGVEIEKSEDIALYFNTLVDVNGLKNSLGKKSAQTISLSTQADKKYWDLFKDLYVNRKVYLWVGKYGDADDDSKWLKVDVTGSYGINRNTSKNSANFTVELVLPQQLNAQY